MESRQEPSDPFGTLIETLQKHGVVQPSTRESAQGEATNRGLQETAPDQQQQESGSDLLLEILRHLHDSGPEPALQLMEEVGRDPIKISDTLKHMQQADLVVDEGGVFRITPQGERLLPLEGG